MSASKIRKSAVELFVQAIVRQNKKGVIQIKFVNKAIALINDKLNDTSTAESVTHVDSIFTRELKFFLAQVSLAGNTESLNRAKTLLQEFIA
jgi:hypothetical protein